MCEEGVTNDTYINAGSVCELLHRMAALGLTVPITLILDNARTLLAKSFTTRRAHA